MKIRVLSDLHVDVNDFYPKYKSLQLTDNDVFTIVAGDTAGSPEIAIDWIQKNVQKGLVISGNHIVYSGGKRPIQDLKQQMALAFPKESPITYLDHMTGVMSKEIDDILFVGTTLYTDYTLSPDIPAENAMRYAGSRSLGLNDFCIGYTKSQDKIRPIIPPDYRRWFIESKKEMTRIIETNPNKEVVVITHHCPSERCCTDEWNLLNPSYASNLENFIKEHPNIKLWIAGHVHQRKNFKIENCLVLMNPRGYEFEWEALRFNPNTFVETKDWSIYQAPIKVASNKNRQATFQQMLKRASLEI